MVDLENSDQRLLETLYKYNPWWKDGRTLPGMVPSFHRQAFQDVQTILNLPIRRFPLLSGMRRTGKTTILYQTIDSLLQSGIPPENILYISLDHPLLHKVNLDEILDLFESIRPITGPKFVFFDEIQYADSWERWLKVIYDSKQDLQVVATGSASPILEGKAADSGVGRWNVVRVPSLSFFEYCSLVGLPRPPHSDLKLMELSSVPSEDLLQLSWSFRSYLPHFHRYLTVGGFPELVLANSEGFVGQMLREDIIDRVIHRDLLYLFGVQNPQQMENLFTYLCMHTSEIFNPSTAAKELDGMNLSTLETYVRALEMSNLIYRSMPVSLGGKAALKARPKIYIADPAIRNAVLGRSEFLSDSEYLSTTVESLVYGHLESMFRPQGFRLGYFREANAAQKEIDVIVQTPLNKLLCEVKYRSQARLDPTDALVQASRNLDSNETQAFLITRNLEDIGVLPLNTQIPIMRVPAMIFLYLANQSQNQV